MMLELRHILRTSGDEDSALRRMGIVTRDEKLLAQVRVKVARMLAISVDNLSESDFDSAITEAGPGRFYYNGLSRLQALGMTGIFGLQMLALGRTEIVALCAAAGVDIAPWERSVALSVLLFSLMTVVIVPVGLEVYKQVGLLWTWTVYWLYWFAGGVATIVFLASVWVYTLQF